MMRKRTKRQLACLLLVAWALLASFSSDLWAEGLLGMRSPDDVMRGQSFRITVTAPGLEAGVAAVEASLQYDSANFQFVKANSVFLGTPGSQVASPNTGIFELQDNLGQVRLLAGGVSYVPVDRVIAELEFIAKADANIGPASFQFSQGSFVSPPAGDKITATMDKLNLQIIDAVTEPVSDTPLEPIPPTAPPTSPGIDVPYDPANQIGPVGDSGDDSSYAIGAPNSETRPTETTSPPSKPTMPEPKSTVPPQPRETESPLRSITGELLYVPADGLPVSVIPAGFRGDTESISDVFVPCAKGQSSSGEITIYYLTNQSKASFYTYDRSIDRFKPYQAETEETKAANTQSRFSAKSQPTEAWKILLWSLLSLSALTVLIYTTARNLRG
ncbi:MAG: cohesin domain-containing protein [Eubacteriales bacterium]|nr:cohesin domain-containing protein [Eubacteriales bacterium]